MKKFLILISFLAAFSATAYVSICNTEAKSRTMQKERVCFTIVNELGEPIVGATVMIKGTLYGERTNTDGEACIYVTRGDTIVISAISYNTIEFVYNGQVPTMVTLVEDC